MLIRIFHRELMHLANTFMVNNEHINMIMPNMNMINRGEYEHEYYGDMLNIDQ